MGRLNFMIDDVGDNGESQRTLTAQAQAAQREAAAAIPRGVERVLYRGDDQPIEVLDFFNGVPYADGLKALNDFVALNGDE